MKDISPDLKVLEEKIMDLLLEGKHPVLRALRQQWKDSKIESVELSGVGFFINYSVPSDVPSLPGRQNLSFGDVEYYLKGLDIACGMVFFVRDGRITMLEGYTFGNSWPEMIEVTKIGYLNSQPRNQEMLLRNLIDRFAVSVKDSATEPKVKHSYGLPPEVNDGVDNRIALPRARVLLLQQENDGFFLYRLDANGNRITDTWHQSLEEAKHQASFEYEDALSMWMKVPEPVDNVTDYVRKAEAMRTMFNRVDPMGIFFDINIDEYDAEIYDLIYPYSNAVDLSDKKAVQERLRPIFDKWFGTGSAPKDETLAKLAEAISNEPKMT